MVFEDKMIKGITLFDIHTPEEDRPSLRAVEMFMRDFKPNYLIWGGDLGEFDSFSHWNKGRITFSKTDEDFDSVDEIIRRHQKICGKIKYIYLEGNHEFRIGQYCQETPNYIHRDEYDLPRRLQLKKRKIDFIPLNKAYTIKKLRFTHGYCHLEHHAKKTQANFGSNIVYGHMHTEQVYTFVSEVDASQRRTGKGRPCLCNLNPEYRRNKASAWTHGFSVWYVRDDGSFNEYCVHITKGRFTFNDKTYDGN